MRCFATYSRSLSNPGGCVNNTKSTKNFEITFFAASRLGVLRQEHDANCTYEGESNVLIQQASNWLLNQYATTLKGKNILSPLESAKFLNNVEGILKLKFNHTTVEETLRPESNNKRLNFYRNQRLEIKDYKNILDLF